jgi:hypothetical protein
MIIKLKSVGSVMDTDTKITYAMYDETAQRINGTLYDKQSGVHIDNCSKDWMAALSVEDMKEIQKYDIKQKQPYFFEVDEKHTIWKRTSFTINAFSHEEARDEMIKRMKDNTWDDFNSTDFETLYDTSEYILPEDNDNQSTLELLDVQEKETIWDNCIK